MPAKYNTSSLLQKVNSQLRGERIPVKANDEDEVAVYLNNLTQKMQKSKTENFEEYGDACVSSGADGKNSGSLNDNNSSSPAAPMHTPASRFLKKKPGLDVSTSFEGEKAEFNVKNKKKATVTANRKAPYKSRSSTEKTDALIRTGKKSGLRRLLSKDSESEGSTKGSDIGLRSGSADTAARREGRKLLKSQRTLVENDQLTFRSSSSQSTKRNVSQGRKSQQRNGRKHEDEIARTLGSKFVPSDQDSLAEFIQGLSMSESSAKRPQNLVAKKQQKWRKKTSSSVSHSPSPVQGSRSPSPLKRSKSPFGRLSRSVSQDTDMADIMDSEILENRQGSDNSDDHLKINLMDVASLLPSSSPPPRNRKTTEKHSNEKSGKTGKSSISKLITSPATVVKVNGKERIKSPKMSSKMSESRSSVFDGFGIHMADELLNFNKGKDAELDISEESEIKTESSGRQRKAIQRQHYESGKSTNIEVKKRSSLLDTSLSEVTSVGNFADRRSHDVTDGEYSDSFDSESKIVTRSASLKYKDKKSRSRAHESQNDSQSHRRRNHKVVMEEMLVDVSVADVKGNRHHWNTAHMDVRVSTPYGLQYVDPAPVATHVVSADALEALTAYSPNILALQEMMKAQLQLVKNFMDIQHRIYQSCMDGLNYDYKYTTLEDTREYISKNRTPGMTFQEALQLVEEEEATTA